MNARCRDDFFHEVVLRGHSIKCTKGRTPFCRCWNIKIHSPPLTEDTHFIKSNIGYKCTPIIVMSKIARCYSWVMPQPLMIPCAIELAVYCFAQEILELYLGHRQPGNSIILFWYLEHRETCLRINVDREWQSHTFPLCATQVF